MCSKAEYHEVKDTEAKHFECNADVSMMVKPVQHMNTQTASTTTHLQSVMEVTTWINAAKQPTAITVLAYVLYTASCILQNVQYPQSN